MKALITFALIIGAILGHSQNSVSFYHLGNTTYQNSNFNPSWIPEGRLFVGLPGISGIHASYNNKLSYNEVFTKTSDSILLDIDKVLLNLQNQNLVSTHADVSLLHIGYRFRQGGFLSVFANERIQSDVLFSEELIRFLWQGSEAFLGEEIKVSHLGTKNTHFREIGIGYAYSPTSRLDIGVRGKYLIGFFDASTPQNLGFTLKSDPNSFAISADWQNTQLRTSGIDILQGNEGDLGSHLVSNGNTGLGLDMGVTYKWRQRHTIAASATDIGFINWREDITNYSLNDTTFTYDGVDLDSNINDLEQLLQDSLFSLFKVKETEEAYRSWLPLRTTASWIYHLGDRTDLYATISSRFVQRKAKVLYGAGITRHFSDAFTFSLSATKLPQQFFNFGSALAVKGGPVQVYLAADQVINFSVPDAHAIDVHFGINLIFNDKKSKVQKEVLTPGQPRGVTTYTFQGQRVETIRKEGVYSVIKKQKPRKITFSYIGSQPLKQSKTVYGQPKTTKTKWWKFWKN